MKQERYQIKYLLDQSEIAFARKRKALKEMAVIAKTQDYRAIKKYMKKYKRDGELREQFESSSEESDVDEAGRNVSQYKK